MTASPTLTSEDLAKRWHVTRLTLARWRMEGSGPPYVKLGAGAQSRVIYLLQDIEAWERDHRHLDQITDQ